MLYLLKGTVQRDFRPQVFSSLDPAWAPDQRIKIFSILVKFSTSSSNFSGYHTALSQSLRNIILRGVTHDPAISLNFFTGLLRDSVTKINVDSYSS